jgi:hypothetical protein
VFFVASENYRGAGPRFDPVEVNVEVERAAAAGAAAEGVVEEHAADVIAYFHHPVHGTYAAIRYYASLGVDPEFGVFVMTPYLATHTYAYGVVPIEAIQCHAHLVPDFDKVDAHGRYSEFYWDKVCSAAVCCSARQRWYVNAFMHILPPVPPHPQQPPPGLACCLRALCPPGTRRTGGCKQKSGSRRDK